MIRRSDGNGRDRWWSTMWLVLFVAASCSMWWTRDDRVSAFCAGNFAVVAFRFLDFAVVDWLAHRRRRRNRRVKL